MNITRRFASTLFCLLGFLPMIGCGPTTDAAKTRQEQFELTAPPSYHQSPHARFARYKTFSVFPFSEEPMDPQLLFFLRNELERKGYTFATGSQIADLMVTQKLFASGEPIVLPPASFTSFAASSPTAVANFPVWGAYHAPSSTDALDLNAPQTFIASVAPPAINSVALVVAYDHRSGKEVWHGTGRSNSDNPDGRVSGQFAIAEALTPFPHVKPPPRAPPPAPEGGALGIRVGVYTADGTLYLPTILAFASISPARDAGIKTNDRITAVNGVSLANFTFHDAMALLHGLAGTIANIDVLRDNQPMSFKIKRLPWRDVWGDSPEE